MTVCSLWDDIQNDPEHYLRGRSGKDIEHNIADRLQASGLVSINTENAKQMPNWTEIKESLLSGTAPTVNATGRKDAFVQQPFGSNNYPDFVILGTEYVLPVEVKSIIDSTSKLPKWNSGLPRPYGNYVFANTKLRDITFFRGQDIITAEEYHSLQDFFEAVKHIEQHVNTYHSSQQYGFHAYIRKDYNQGKQFNPNAITDFFGNPNRAQLEQLVKSHTATI